MEFKYHISKNDEIMDIGKSVCHSLNEIGGEVIGDEMEVAIFHKMEAKIS